MQDDWDSFDPLSEDYYDESKNSYNTGAGANMEYQSANRRGKEKDNLFTLWIRPLKSRYTEDSLKNIFSLYGSVTDVKIIYPKSGDNPFGYVTFKTQAAATEAIRGLNDNDKFEFKVSYAKERAPRNNYLSNNPRFNDSGPSRRRPDTSKTEETTPPPTTITEPSLEFTKVSKRTNVDRGSETFKPRNNDNFRPKESQDFKSRPLPQFTAPVSTSNSTVIDRNGTHEMESNTVTVEKEPEATKPKRAYIKPQQCCHCQKVTFNVCEECHKSFCHAECSLDGWRNHTTPECVQVANLVKFDTINTTQIARPTTTPTTPITEVNINVSSEPASVSNNKVRKYASDYNSPSSEYNDFSNLVQDYIENGNKNGVKDPALVVSKPNDIPDNNYDHEFEVETPIEEQSDRSSLSPNFQQERARSQQHNRNDSNNHERGAAQHYRQRDDRFDQERGAARNFRHREDNANDQDRNRGQGKGYNYKPRGDDRDQSNDYGRGSGGGQNDYDRNSGGGRQGWNRDRRSRDSTDGAGEFSSGRNRDGDGRSGFDRRRNFNDRNDRRQSDEIDKGGSHEGNAKPSRSSYQNDGRDGGDGKIGFDRSRGGYQGRNNADAGRENGERESQRLSSQPAVQKGLELNQIVQVTVAFVERDGKRCYVRLADNEGIFQNMFKSLNAMKLEPFPFKENRKCVALLNNEWHRGLIYTKNERSLRVHFIDVGIMGNIDPQHIREVPEEILKYRPFAHRVTLSNASPEEISKWYTENTVISVKPTDFNKNERFFTADVISFADQLVGVKKDDCGSQRPSGPVSTPPAPPAAAEPRPKVTFRADPQLQRAQPADVFVTFIENEKEFFVTFKEPVVDMCRRLSSENVDTLSAILNPQKGSWALTSYEANWCRVEIVSTDPVRISFLDFGNVEYCELKSLKMLPDSCANIPPLAIRVKLHSGTVSDNDIAESTEIKITPIRKENDTWLVLVGDKSAESELLSQQMQALSVSSPQPVSSRQPVQPKPRVTFEVLITYAESKRLVYGIRKTDLSSFKEMNIRIAELAPFDPASSPVLNKIYLKEYDGMCCRARLINVEPTEIYFIDYGNSETCRKEELFELPEEFQDVPPWCIKLTLEKESRNELNYGSFVSVSWDMDRDTYLLEHDSTDSDALAASSNKTVNVVSALGDSNYAVMLEENRSVYKYIFQKINADVFRLRKPKKIEINSLCLAFYEEDDLWHRAKIVSKSPLTVSFLDFANETPCEFAQLRQVPPELAGIPPLVFKIKTEDFIDLDVGSEVKITLLEELDHNYWKVATIKEKDLQVSSNKRIEIISDVKHISSIKKRTKAALNDYLTPPPASNNVIVIDDDDDDDDVVEIKIKPGTSKDSDNISKHIRPSRGKSLVKPFDETSLVLTRLTNPPKNYAKSTNMITKGVDDLSLIEPKRNSTFYDINVPIAEHLLDVLHCGDSCILIVYDSLSDDEYAGMLLCQRLGSVLDVLDGMEDTANNAETISAKKGDLVVAFVNGINAYVRGYVVYEPTDIDPFYTLMLFDAGKLYKTDAVFCLNDEFRSVPQLAVRINVTCFQQVPDDVARLEVIPMNVNLYEGDTFQHDKSIYRVELTGTTEDGFKAELMSKFCKENITHKINLTKWRPTREEIGVKHVPVMTGDLVNIGSMCLTNHCYIIPADDAINEQRMDFLAKVATHCKHAKSIENELKINDIVGVSHAKSYYRAQVIERKVSAYIVRILDTGEQIRVLKTNIKPLPDILKFADCYAICVQLHEVPCTDFNQLAIKLVKYVRASQYLFALEFNDSSRKVVLKFDEDVTEFDAMKGSSFNKLLSEYLVPLWKREDFDFDARFFLCQMTFEEWPIGAELSLHFAEVYDERSGFMINRYGETYADLIRVNLNYRLKEYAEECKEASYVPIKEELCVVKLDNSWHRAVCIHAEPGKDFEIQFIDIGFHHYAPHTDIRRMHNDFLKHPAAAIFCKIVNYKECPNLPELKGRVLKKCRVLKKIESGGYDIQIANLSAYYNAA